MNRFVLLAILGSGAPAAVSAQEASGTDARDVFNRVAPSVFSVEVRDSTGRIIRTGTAFVTEGGRFVSNAHVVSPGLPSLRVGALAVPLSVQRIDVLNDLAVLTVEARLDAPQLAIATTPLAVGTRVYAVGNPQGLANSLSEGLVSGLRTLEGRDLIQLTAAISPGSSGGPVVNPSGEVVGVTVGAFTRGQSLNFAVPTDKLRQLLEGSTAVMSL